MRLSLVHDRRFQNHVNPASHPESVKRLSVFDKYFQESSLPGKVSEIEPVEASEDEIAMVHSSAYVEKLKECSEIAEYSNQLVAIDGDTYLSPKTYETAKLAAGAGLTSLKNMSDNNIDSSFVAVRPPGHHALAAKGMGFCLFNNVAVTVRNAQKQGFNRVFVLDWDVHHGNGTEGFFYDDPSVFFLSVHKMPPILRSALTGLSSITVDPFFSPLNGILTVCGKELLFSTLISKLSPLPLPLSGVDEP